MATVGTLDKEACLLVPAKSKTLSGFRSWLFKEGLDSSVRVSYLAGDLYIEMYSGNLAEPLGFVVPAKARTHAGFREWLIEEWGDRPGRICYLDGDLFIDMSPDEIETHNKIRTETTSTLVVLNKRLKKGTFYSDGTLITNRKARLSAVPDGTFVLWETLQSGRVKFKERKDFEGECVELIGDHQPQFTEEGYAEVAAALP